MTPLPALVLVSPAAVEAVAHHAAGAVVSGVWEGILLVTATALLLRVVSGTTAKLRFAVWTGVFLVLALLPLVNGFRYGSVVGGSIAAVPLGVAPLHVDARWSYALAALWLAAIVFRLGNLGVQVVRLRLLWRSAAPAAPETLAGLELRLGGVQICTSAELDRPSVIGFFAPRILLPDWLFEQLTEGELRQIVLHEMEHLRRRDDWMNLLQKVGLVLFPLNPALLWIDRQLATERELACDDGVLKRTRAPRAYATCLTSVAERRLARRMSRRGHGRLTALALGALGAIRRPEFSRRIESILNRTPDLTPAASRVLAMVFLAGVLGMAGVLAHAPELVAFGPEAGAESAAAVALPAAPLKVLPVAAVSPVAAIAKNAGSARMEDAVYHPQAVQAQPVPVKPVAVRQAAKPVAKTRVAVTSNGETKKIPAVPVEQADVVANPIPPFVQNQGFAAFAQTMEQQRNEQQRRLILPANWQDSVPVPVFVTLPDGRVFFATYTPTPSHTGWVLFQL